MNRMTDQCKNITLPQSSFAGGNKQMSLNGLFCRIRILILIGTANRMATFYYVELFTLHGVEFKLPYQLPTTGMESVLESEFGSVNVNKP